MITDPSKTYADIRVKDRVVFALFTGVSEIPEWAMQRRLVVEVPVGVTVEVGDIYYDGAFRKRRADGPATDPERAKVRAVAELRREVNALPIAEQGIFKSIIKTLEA